MKENRRKHGQPFKSKVAMEALKGGETIAQLASWFEVHSNRVSTWKKALADVAADVFGESSIRLPGFGKAFNNWCNQRTTHPG
jgi:transposase-like protein